MVIGGHKYGTVYAIDNSYCAYKSVTALLNHKDPYIRDFKTELFYMHEDGLLAQDKLENLLESYGINQALPIYTGEDFDKGFDNFTIFKRDCLILIDGNDDNKLLKHLIAYKAAGKKYVKLLEMLE